MYQTKSGKKFGSAYAGKKYDEMHPEGVADKVGEGDKSLGKPKTASEPKAEPRTTPMGEAKTSKMNAHAEPNDVKGMNMNESSPMPSAVVAEHGPASSVHVKHDHVAKKHHVTSMHQDGHVNESDHESAQDAHDAAAQLGGEANTENNDKEANADQTDDSDMFGNDGFKVPHLA